MKAYTREREFYPPDISSVDIGPSQDAMKNHIKHLDVKILREIQRSGRSL